MARKSIRTLHYKEIPLIYKYDFNESLHTCKVYWATYEIIFLTKKKKYSRVGEIEPRNLTYFHFFFKYVQWLAKIFVGYVIRNCFKYNLIMMKNRGKLFM